MISFLHNRAAQALDSLHSPFSDAICQLHVVCCGSYENYGVICIILQAGNLYFLSNVRERPNVGLLNKFIHTSLNILLVN